MKLVSAQKWNSASNVPGGIDLNFYPPLNRLYKSILINHLGNNQVKLKNKTVFGIYFKIKLALLCIK